LQYLQVVIECDGSSCAGILPKLAKAGGGSLRILLAGLMMAVGGLALQRITG